MSKNSAVPAAPPSHVSGLLEEMTLDARRSFDPQIVVLPLGSVEPHGPHLPLGTDIFQVTSLCRRAVSLANEEDAKVLLYPTLPITTNVNMRKIPFALRIGVRTLMQLLIDIASQCYEDGIRKVVIVNGHGGNPAIIEAALREIAGMDDMPFVCMTRGFLPEGVANPIEHPSDHAGESETSRMLAIRPDLVHTDKLANNPFGRLAVPLLAQCTFVRPWHLYMPETAGGETRHSSAEKGRRLNEGLAQGLAQFLVQLSQTPYSERFPYE
jgi:creatinine amidohydrolase